MATHKLGNLRCLSGMVKLHSVYVHDIPKPPLRIKQKNENAS